MTKTMTKFEIIPIEGALGAEIKCDDVRLLDEDDRKAVRQAWLDNIVLLFRGQHLTNPEFVEFGKIFGTPQIGATTAYYKERIREGADHRECPEVRVVSNVKDANGKKIGVLGDGECIWHTDASFSPIPYDASILMAMEIPDTWGGNTGFLNMYAALGELPGALREKIEGRTIKCDDTRTSAGEIRSDAPPVTDVSCSPGPIHPIIRTHPETKYNALYLGRRPLGYINGYSVAESEELLDRLFEHTEHERFSWHHAWRVGDIVIWDNRCAMHHRDPFDPNARRIMHRLQTAGTKPFYDPKGSRAEAHPRGR